MRSSHCETPDRSHFLVTHRIQSRLTFSTASTPRLTGSRLFRRFAAAASSYTYHISMWHFSSYGFRPIFVQNEVETSFAITISISIRFTPLFSNQSLAIVKRCSPIPSLRYAEVTAKSLINPYLFVSKAGG